MKAPKKTVTNEDRYRNLSTAQSCIKVVLIDTKTGQNTNAIFGNEEFARLLAEKRGLLIDKQGRFEDQKAYIRFLNEDYANYMIKNDGKVIDAGIDIKKYNSILTFSRPMTLEELNIKDEGELLKKYFDFDYKKGSGMLKGKYYEKYTRDPAFIALLIDLGYDAVWGDYVLNLNIYTEPFISRLTQKYDDNTNEQIEKNIAR